MSLSDENLKRIKDVYFSTLEDIKNLTEELTTQQSLNSQVLKTISSKLIPYIKTHCVDEYKELTKKYIVVYDHEYGAQFSLRDGKEQPELINNIEKCADKHFGINKLIMLTEAEAENLKSAHVYCNRQCIDNDLTFESDSKLKDCFKTCYEDYHRSYSQTLNKLSNDLSIINSKI
jgi:hypothetical protein